MNAIVPHVGAYADTGKMPRSRVLRAYLAEVRCELTHGLRSPQMTVFTLLFPVMFYLLVAFVFGPFRHPNPDMRAYVLIGFIIMATMTPGFTSFSWALALEREKGLYTLRRALPMPAAANIVAKAAMALLCVAIVTPVLMVLGMLIGQVELSFPQMASVWTLALAGALPFCALGFFIGMHASARAVPVFVNLLLIPMLYLSGVLFPSPEGFSWIARLMPPFYLQQAMLAVAGLPHQFLVGPLVHMAVLGGLTALFTGLTVRRFRVVG
jgi:ABC-2 type transport system permease protein